MANFGTTPTGESEYSGSASESAKADRDTGRTADEVSEVQIEPTKNGGFSVKCRYRQPDSKGGQSPYMEPDTFAFSTVAELHQFIDQQFGSAAPAASVTTETPAAAPPPAADEEA